MSTPTPIGIVLPGIDVPLGPVVLGANAFGSVLGTDASFALLDCHLERGGTFIDTALVYADWLSGVEPACSERLLGRWLHSRGAADIAIVATKGGHPDLAAPQLPRLDPAALRLDVSRSLEHLGLSRLPLWWLHRDDPQTPVGEILDAVEALRADDLLAAWGVCNWKAARLRELLETAASRAVPGPVAASVGFALAPPAPGALAADLVTLDPPLARLHHAQQLPLVAYSAQAKGWFDKVTRGVPSSVDPVYDHGSARQVAAVLASIGRELDATPTEVALAALRLLPFPLSAVVGPQTVAQVDSSWRATRLELNEEHRAVLRPWVNAAIAAISP